MKEDYRTEVVLIEWFDEETLLFIQQVYCLQLRCFGSSAVGPYRHLVYLVRK